VGGRKMEIKKGKKLSAFALSVSMDISRFVELKLKELYKKWGVNEIHFSDEALRVNMDMDGEVWVSLGESRVMVGLNNVAIDLENHLAKVYNKGVLGQDSGILLYELVMKVIAEGRDVCEMVDWFRAKIEAFVGLVEKALESERELVEALEAKYRETEVYKAVAEQRMIERLEGVVKSEYVFEESEENRR
jgi:hypothetical protein